MQRQVAGGSMDCLKSIRKVRIARIQRQGEVWLGLVGHVKYLCYPKFVGKDLSAVERHLSQGLWYMKKRRNVKKN